MYSGLSIFDLDGTLVTINSSFAFGRKMKKIDRWDVPPSWYCLWYYCRYQLASLTLEELHHKAFESIFKHRYSNKIKEQAIDFWNHSLEQVIHLPTLARLEQARKENHYIVLLSSSPDFLVEPIAHYLKVDQWRSTSYTLDSKGCFNGIQKIIMGAEKAEIALEIAQRLSIDPSSIFAYTDSYLDLPLLKIAGHVIAVNPDRKLQSLSLQKRWEMI